MAKVWPVWPEVDRGSCIVHRAREMYSPGDQDTKRSPERREGARGFFWCGVDWCASLSQNDLQPKFKVGSLLISFLRPKYLNLLRRSAKPVQASLPSTVDIHYK